MNGRMARNKKLSKLAITAVLAAIASPSAIGADGQVLPIKQISASSQQLVVEFSSSEFPTAPQVLDLPGPNHRVIIDFADATLDKGSLPAAEELSAAIAKSLPFVSAVRYQELENAPKPTARVVLELPEKVKVKPRVMKLEKGMVVIALSDQVSSQDNKADAGSTQLATSGESELRGEIPEITQSENTAADSANSANPVPKKMQLDDGSVVNVKMESVKRYNKAVQLHLSGKLNDAIAAYKAALEVNPALAEAHSNLGLIFNQQHNYAQALAEFRKALAINPKDAITYNGIGAALRAEHDLQGAIKNWQTSVTLDPKLATAHYNLGTAYEIEKEYDKALTSYRLAVKNDYRLGEAYYRMGLILERKHKGEEAAEQFKESLKISTDSEYSEDARQRLAFLQSKKAKTQ